MKRIVVIVGGFLLLVAGIVLLPLPGPGWVVIALALAVLAREFVWARRLLDRVKHLAGKLTKRSPPERRDTPEP